MRKNTKLVEQKVRCPVCNGHAIKGGNPGDFFQTVCSRCKSTGKITKYSVRRNYNV